MKNWTLSRIFGLVGMIGTLASVISITSGVPAKYAAPAGIVSAIITGFTERVNGGKSVATTTDVIQNKLADRIASGA